jgi:hypothetical protein
MNEVEEVEQESAGSGEGPLAVSFFSWLNTFTFSVITILTTV